MKVAVEQGLASYSHGPNLACCLFSYSLQAKNAFCLKKQWAGHSLRIDIGLPKGWEGSRMGQREKLNYNAILCWPHEELWSWDGLSEFSWVGMSSCECELSEGDINLSRVAFLAKAILKERWCLKIICQPLSNWGTNSSLSWEGSRLV